MKKLILLTLCFLATSISFSQTDQEIDPVEVVSLQIPVDVEESGRSITIITQEDIEKSPFTSVDEILRFQAGFNTNSRGGFGVQSDIGIRGGTFSQVLILIDNVRFSEPLTSHLNFSLPIPLNEIARIEIIRGPASALYGADAVGGLIHIKTKAYENKSEGLNTSGYFFLGEESLVDGDASISYNFGKVTLSGAVKNTTSDGQTFRNPNFDLGVAENEEFNTDFDIQSYTLAASFQPSDDWFVNARYGIDERDFNAKYFYTNSSFDESRETTSNDFAQLSIARDKGDNQTQLNLGYRQGTDFFVFNPLFTPNDHETQRFSGLLRHSITNDQGYTFGFGAQLESQEIELPLSDDFTVMASQRLGSNDEFGISYTPQMSASYNKNNFVVRSSLGWAVRAPDFTERFVSDLIPNLSPGRNIGNPDLVAEESFTVDLGGSYLPIPNLKLDASGFFRDSNNLIDFVVTNADDITTADNLQSGEDYFFSQNVAEAQTWGIEFQGALDLQLHNDNSLSINLNYTYLDTEIANASNSKNVANHPNHQINSDLNLLLGNFNASLNTQWINREEDTLETINALVQPNY